MFVRRVSERCVGGARVWLSGVVTGRVMDHDGGGIVEVSGGWILVRTRRVSLLRTA